MRSLLRWSRSDTAMSRIVRGSFWNGLSTLLSRGATFIAVVIVARILGPDLFGRFGILQAAIASFTAVGALGMGIAATKLVAERRLRSLEDAVRGMTASLWLAVIAGVALAATMSLTAPYLANVILLDGHLVGEVRLSAVALLFGCVVAAQLGILAGFEAFAQMAVINTIIGALTLVALPLLTSHFGLHGALVSLALSGAIHCACNQIAIHRTLRANGVKRIRYLVGCDFKNALSIGIPAALSTLLYLPANWICATLLTRTPQGYAEVAVFTAVDQWFNIILTVAAIIGQAMLPVMASVFSGGVGTESRDLLKRATVINAVISALPLVILIPLGPHLLRIYGPSYSAYALTFAITVATAGLAAGVAPAAQAMFASGKLWQAFLMNLAWAFTYVILTVWLVVAERGGVLALAMARAVAYALHAGWLVAYVAVAFKNGQWLSTAPASDEQRR